jgi:hypothetical protein
MDGSTKLSRPEPLFELVVKPVCDYCNNGWMNDLDSVVEPWLLEPSADDSQCDPAQFRRWAIKVAVLRSYYENPLAPQPEDFSALYNGQDVPDWHIFVGRTLLPNHSHTFVGFGPLDGETGGRILGITQVSWSLGRVIVVAIRLIRDSETATSFFRMFKSSNRSEGIVVAEVLPKAKKLPSLAMLPELSLIKYQTLSLIKYQTLVWYFSTNPLSPISEAVLGLEDGFRSVMNDANSEYTEL